MPEPKGQGGVTRADLSSRNPLATEMCNPSWCSSGFLLVQENEIIAAPQEVV